MSENVFDTGMGIKLRRGTDGNVESWMGYDIWKTVSVVPAVLEALQSFFQWERDQQLGRVRYPDNPDWIVYEEKYGQITVVDEAVLTYITLDGPKDLDAETATFGLNRAAHWYYENRLAKCGAEFPEAPQFTCNRKPHPNFPIDHWHEGDGFDVYWTSKADK